MSNKQTMICQMAAMMMNTATNSISVTQVVALATEIYELVEKTVKEA